MAIIKAMLQWYIIELFLTVVGFFLALLFNHEWPIFIFWGIVAASLLPRFFVGVAREIKDFSKNYKHANSNKD